MQNNFYMKTLYFCLFLINTILIITFSALNITDRSIYPGS